MDELKKQQVFAQYIFQYLPVIKSTLNGLRLRNNLHIPYAQFLFSIIDYFGLLYVVAVNKKFNKRDKNNFTDFFKSIYFPETVRCKASFLYFIRNGLIHQVFAKGCSIGISDSKKLFLLDKGNGNIPELNLRYLEVITINAINSFTDDLQKNSAHIDNLHFLLIENNYGLNDHKELTDEINGSLGGNYDNIVNDCL